MAVVFVTRMEGDKPINEGLCIKCAKEMNIKPVTDLLDKMGIGDDDIEAMSEQLMELAVDALEKVVPAVVEEKTPNVQRKVTE